MLRLQAPTWVVSFAAACVLPLLAATAGAATVPARMRALLVGVSEYPSLPADKQLHGPRHDVPRWRELLMQRGVPAGEITVLADQVPGAELPTRERILGQLDRLAREARPGDMLVLSFGGHGSQQPVPAGSPHTAEEPDGMFEIFLPRDVQGWSGGAGGQVRNAILDHEVRATVDRMVASGASVWVVFDSCHSATMVRGGGADGVRARQVAPSDLGVPADALRRAAQRAGSAMPSRPAAPPAAAGGVAPGSAVYFYAAQTREVTVELPLPLGHPHRQPHGVFSHLIAEALDGGGGLTYRQLAQQVLARFGSVREARNTPIFAGTGLDQPVLGQDAPPVQQWRLESTAPLALSAGALAGLTPGSMLAVLPSAASPMEQVIGYARATQVDLARSTLEPVAHAGKPAAAADALARGVVARLVQSVPDLRLSIATDLSKCEAPCLFEAAIRQLQEGTGTAALPGIAWSASREPARLLLKAVGRRLWLLSPAWARHPLCTDQPAATRSACESAIAENFVSITVGTSATPSGLAGTLRQSLAAVAKAERLLRVAAMANRSAFAKQLAVTIRVSRAGAPAVPIEHASLRCLGTSASIVPCLRAGDVVELELGHRGSSPVDVSVLYVDSRHGVGAIFPRDGAVNRLDPGVSVRTRMTLTDDTLGLERVLVFAIEVPGRHGDRVDLSFVAQASLPSAEVTRTAGTDADDVRRLFREAGFGAGLTRSAEAAPVPARVGAVSQAWQVTRDRPKVR